MKHFNKLMASLLPVFILLVSGMAVNAQPLNGTYTIYGTSPDYANLQAAANDLNNKGVSGPVVFKVRPGTWSSSSTSKAQINNVSGASSTNTITFEAENGSAATTTIRNTSSSSSTTNNQIFYFNSAKYIIVKNLTLEKSSSSYGTCVRYAGAAQYNIVENCVLTGPSTTSSSTSRARVYATGMGNGHHNIIRDNTINGGSYAIRWWGSSSSSSGLSEDNEFTGNTVTNAGYYGIYTYYTKRVKVNNNDITRTSSGTFYGIYARYADGSFEVNGNKVSRNSTTTSTTYPIYFYYCDGTSSERGSINNNEIDIATRGSIYNQLYYSNYIDFKANEISVVSSNTSYVYPLNNYNYSNRSYDNDIYIEDNEFYGKSNGYVYLYGHYRNSTNPVFNNNDIELDGRYANYVYMAGDYARHSEIIGNKVVIDNTSYSSSYNYVYGGGQYYDQGLEFSNNDIDINSAGYIYTYIGFYGFNNNTTSKYYNNKMRLVSSNSRNVYNYMAYYNDKAEIIGNDIYCESRGRVYGLYAYSSSGFSGPFVVKNNNIVANCKASNYAYGLYNYYAQGLEMANNTITAISGSYHYAYLGGYQYKSNGGANIYNNSFVAAGTGYGYAFYSYQYGSYGDVKFYNNAVARLNGGNGYAMYLGEPSQYEMDYNNIYNGGASMVYYGWTGQQFSSITAWRAGMNTNMNSLDYNPGFTNPSQGDLTPDPANANSWSLNGRGVQIAGNDKDINGTPRALTTITGVPDIGAHEFTPTATPPVCAATPGVPTAGGTQTFTFGEDTVAVINWGATVPTGLTLRQRTGTNPPGILSINPTQMFYYVDMDGSGSNLDYEMDFYYKDPWIGTIASESALRLAENVNNSGWSGYAPTVSSSNTNRNFINTPGVDDVNALFTGIDVKDNAGVEAIVEPTPPFCPGTYTVKALIKNNGNNDINNLKITWELDGVNQGTINYNTTININGSPQGNEAVITLGSVTFGNAARAIKVWTHEPNGNQDPVSGDDTLEVDYRAALQGTYTVGGTNPDFAVPIDAASAITQFGTCGDVVFDVRPGTYTGQLGLQQIVSASNTPDRVTFQAENGNPGNTIISYSGSSSSDAGTIVLDNASRYTFRNMGIYGTGSYGYGVHFVSAGSSLDSFIGCDVVVSSAASSAYAPVYCNNQKDCNYNVFTDCKLEGGYWGVNYYSYTPPNYNEGLVVNNCTMNPYYYGIYAYYMNGPTFTNNTIEARYNAAYYGIIAYEPYRDDSKHVTNVSGNRLIGFRGYSFYIYYPGGRSTERAKIMNNSIVTSQGQVSYYPMFVRYPEYTDIMNNTCVNNGPNSGSYYGGYIDMGISSYRYNNVYNNVFANLAGGYAAYIRSSSNTNVVDYNNYYTTSSSNFIVGSSTAKSLSAWRNATGFDMHSVTYDPVITSNTDPTPNVKDEGVWALNGHGLQIDGNTSDINGNPRIDKREDGVPDIGAYEVDPEVIPPLATATPAQEGPGITQVFSFAGNEVASVTWDAGFPVTAPLEVRQYSGVKGPDVAAQAAPEGSMYFYTDIKQKGNGTTYDFDATVNYMDIWLGDITQEGDLKLAFRYDNSYPWMVYNAGMSSVNPATDVLSGTDLHHFGWFTGLEDGSIPSAFVDPQGSIVICIGNTVQLNAEPQNGDSYQWKRNGTDIAGANGTSLSVSQPGDYSVVITFTTQSGTKTVESVPVTVSTIAPPNAIVTASGPLTYCTGGNLQLDAGSAQGVTYQWQLNGNDIPGANGSTYNVNQPGNYTVVATNIGCSSTSTTTAINNGPLVVDLGPDTSFCEQPTIYAKLDAGYPGSKYLWNTGDTTRTIEVKQGGNYWVEVDGGPNCKDRDDINVTISPLPTANGISYVKNGNSYQFSPSGAQNETGYLWLFSDGTQSTQKVATKSVDGELYVRLVLFNACGSDTVQIGWPLNVEEVVAEGQVKVYPNPAKDRVTLSVEGTTLEEVEVLNSVGSVIYRSSAEKGSDSHSINVSGYANGHYMLRAKTSGGMISKPFDVVR